MSRKDKTKSKICKTCKSCSAIKDDSSSFFNSCPKVLEFLPEYPCELGKPLYNAQGKVSEEPQCPWWINSEEHNYCMWTYLRENSHPDGSMDTLLQADIASLMGCSSTKIHFMLKEALQNLKDLEELADFTAYSGDDSALEDLDFGSFELDDNYSPEDEPL